MTATKLAISDKYLSPLKVSVALQIVAALVCSIILDGGYCGILIFSLVAYWLGVLIIVLRRPLKPTRGDIIFVAGGFPLVLIVGWTFAVQPWCPPGYR